MLATLRKIIGKRYDETPPSRPSHPHFVTEQNKIIKLIETIKASPQPCTVMINGSKKIFSTSLIDFQSEQGYLILDAINPIEGNVLLQSVKTLKLSTVVNNIPVSFKLDIMSHGLNGGIPYYKAGLPNRLYYPQRRGAPRIFIRGSSAIHFQAYSKKGGMPITGEVIDLSRGGLCLYLDAIPANFERGDILENCRITLPDEYTVRFDLAICSVKPLRQRKTQVGGYFLNMPPKAKRKLEYYIALMERESIRKQKN